jgi:hypothetical protein
MPPPTVGSRSGRIYYCIQSSTAPPTFVFFVNDPAIFTDNYKRYLERKIRDSLNFDGTPIKMVFRGKALRDVGREARKGTMGSTRIIGGRVDSGAGGERVGSDSVAGGGLGRPSKLGRKSSSKKV